MKIRSIFSFFFCFISIFHCLSNCSTGLFVCYLFSLFFENECPNTYFILFKRTHKKQIKIVYVVEYMHYQKRTWFLLLMLLQFSYYSNLCQIFSIITLCIDNTKQNKNEQKLCIMWLIMRLLHVLLIYCNLFYNTVYSPISSFFLFCIYSIAFCVRIFA